MTAPIEIQVKSWKQLVEIDEQVANKLKTDPEFFFRGQARADWKVVPSLLRVAESNNLDAQKTLWLEKQLVSEFRISAHLYLPPAVLSREELDTVSSWIGMRHYGAPTRLLDWTESLYVAAYFAVERELEQDGAIWGIHPRSIRAAFPIDPKFGSTQGRRGRADCRFPRIPQRYSETGGAGEWQAQRN